MKYEIKSEDPVKQELWQEKSIYVLAGGFKLNTSVLRPESTVLPKGSLLNVDFSSRTASLVKTARVYEEYVGESTALKVNKCMFKTGEFIGDTRKAVEITAIDTTTSELYDTITLSEAIDAENIPVGTILFEVDPANVSDNAIASTGTVTDAATETLMISDPEGHDDLKVVISQNTSDDLAVSYAKHVLTIKLANASAAKNTGALIEAAIKGLPDKDGYNFSRFTATASAQWDSSSTGDALTVDTTTLEQGVIGIELKPRFEANALNYFDVKIEGTPSVSALGRAFEIKESKLPYPVHALNKVSLTARFMFV